MPRATRRSRQLPAGLLPSPAWLESASHGRPPIHLPPLPHLGPTITQLAADLSSALRTARAASAFRAEGAVCVPCAYSRPLLGPANLSRALLRTSRNIRCDMSPVTRMPVGDGTLVDV